MITWPSHLLPLKCEDVMFPIGSTRKIRNLTPVILFLVTLRGQIPVFSGVSDRENDLILTYAYQESVYNGGGSKKTSYHNYD